MIKLHKLIATVFGIGYIGKGGGTIAAVALCLVWILIPASYHNDNWQLFITLFVTAIGVWSGNVVDAIWEKTAAKL
jgi:phosphatidylglycerophosphatase A